MRHAIVILALSSCLPLADAEAQQCHPQAPWGTGDSGVHLSLGMEAAGYQTPRARGSYQGISLRGAWSTAPIVLEVSAPVYRLARERQTFAGFGDLAVGARWTSPLGGGTGATVGLGAWLMAPSGSAEDELGMGHWMAMPYVRGAWADERAFIALDVGYGGVLGTSAGAHPVGGRSPIVNPMNLSELESGLSAGHRLWRGLRGRVGGYGATPVGGAGGVARIAGMAALDYRMGPLDFSIEGHLPLAGQPFGAKVVATMGLRFLVEEPIVSTEVR